MELAATAAVCCGVTPAGQGKELACIFGGAANEVQLSLTVSGEGIDGDHSRHAKLGCVLDVALQVDQARSEQLQVL